jgi:hypothetical protein
MDFSLYIIPGVCVGVEYIVMDEGVGFWVIDLLILRIVFQL